MSITLTCGSFSLTIGSPTTPFTGNSYPRERIDGPSLTDSAYGTPVREGTFYEPKHLWNLECKLKRADRLLLDRLYAYWLLTSPTPAIVLSDYTQELSEPSPRSRGLASGATEATESGMVSYFATFSAEFVEEPRYSQDGAYVTAVLSLREAAKTAP